MPPPTPDLLELVRDFLSTVRRSDDTASYRTRLAEVPESRIRTLDAGAAKAFWLNLYNASAQDTLHRDPGVWSSKRDFFGGDRVTVAGHDLSLDDIEHGLLRHSRWKYGLGYLPRFRPDEFEVRHRLPSVDPRIHFALNCGAESCPGIAPYSATDIDRELDIDTRTHLDQTSERRDGTLYITRLFLYYRGDFGGRDGIYRFLQDHGIIAADERPRIKYRPYDWSLALGRFRDRGGETR